MRRINYKKCVAPIFLIALLFSVIMLTGCERQQTREMRLAKEKADEEKQKKEDLEMFYREHAVLLALKYKVDEKKVFSILVAENELLYRDEGRELGDVISGRNLKKRIERYSEKYDIPTDIIARILIDYRVMWGI